MKPRHVERVQHAANRLGWEGEHVVPVSFLGLSCWAVASLDHAEHQRRSARGIGAVVDRAYLAAELMAEQRKLAPPLRLLGGVVEAADAERALHAAAMLAGYAPRAVLLPDQPSLLGVLADAAVLDVGVVLNTSNGLQLLSEAGPRVPGGQFDAREWLLLETVYDAVLRGTSVEVTPA